MHTIRLRRPWLRFSNLDATPDRVDVPDDSPLACGGGTVTYRRAFNRPTGLATHDRIWLSIEHFSGDSIRVLLNDTPIDQDVTGDSILVDLTSYLEPTNQLSVQLEGSADVTAALDGAVSLQIESH